MVISGVWGEWEGGAPFRSELLQPYIKRTKSVETVLPWLYLKGISTGDFSEALHAEDEVAVEATGNSTWFRDQVLLFASHVAIIAPWQFEVTRRSVKKTDKHDARAIAFFLSKGMLP